MPQSRFLSSCPAILSAFLLLVTGVAQAGSITYTATADMGPNPLVITYTETSTPVGGSHPADIRESASPCDLTNTGCVVASLKDVFPTIALPAGTAEAGATLILDYAQQISYSPFQLVSLTPIDPTKPFSAGSPGNHGQFETFTAGTQAGTLSSYRNDFVFGGWVDTNIDYSGPVGQALLTGGQLDPITLNAVIEYGFKTAQSADPGVNSVATYQRTFSVDVSRLDAVLTIDYVPVPEPSAVLLCLAGLTAFGLWRRFAH